MVCGIGNGLILLGSLCAPLYTLVTRRMIHERDPLVVATLHHTGGLVWAGGVLIIGLLWGGVPALRAFPPHVWALAAISGLGQYALPFWLYVITLKYLPTSRASLFLILIPVCSIGGAALFLGERLTVVQWIGAILILIMVISLVVSSSWEGQQKNSNV